MEPGWADLAANPAGYYDNRRSKWDRNPKAPDFVHKETRAPLWLNSAPPYITDDHRFRPINSPQQGGDV